MRWAPQFTAAVIALLLVVGVGGYVTADRLAADTTGTNTVCATASAPGTTVTGFMAHGVTVPDVVVPDQVTSQCATVTYTVSTQTVTSTVGSTTTVPATTTVPTTTVGNGITVVWIRPLDRQTVSGVLTEASRSCEASALPNSLVDYVEFWIDGTHLNDQNLAPYNCSVDTRMFANGQHVLKAVAYDAVSPTSQASVTVNIQNTTTTTTPTTTAPTTSTTTTVPAGTANVWIAP